MDSDRIKVVVIFLVIFGVLCGYFYLTQGRSHIEQNKLQKQQNVVVSNSSVEPTKPGTYYRIHVAGEVNNPGVYSVDSKCRVIDVLEIAGGTTENADLDRMYLADYIKDGEKIRVPNVNERNNNADPYSGYNLDNFGAKSNKLDTILSNMLTTNNYQLIPAAVSPSAQANILPSTVISVTNTNLVNINTATSSELQSLPGIGSSIANNIIEYREKNGKFQSIEEIKNVFRIGDKVFDKISSLITI